MTLDEKLLIANDFTRTELEPMLDLTNKNEDRVDKIDCQCGTRADDGESYISGLGNQYLKDLDSEDSPSCIADLFQYDSYMRKRLFVWGAETMRRSLVRCLTWIRGSISPGILMHEI